MSEHSHEHTHTHSHPHDGSQDHDHGHSHETMHDHEHTHTHTHPHDHEHEPDHGHAHSHEGEGKDIEILGLLLDHWADHNQEHAKEYKNWVDKMNAVGKTEVSKAIEEAIALIGQADEHLMEAKKALIK